MTRSRPPHNRELAYDNRLPTCLDRETNASWRPTTGSGRPWNVSGPRKNVSRRLAYVLKPSQKRLWTGCKHVSPAQDRLKSYDNRPQSYDNRPQKQTLFLPALSRLWDALSRSCHNHDRQETNRHVCAPDKKNRLWFLPQLKNSEPVENRQAVAHGRSHPGMDVPGRGKVVEPAVHGSSNRVQPSLKPRECKRGFSSFKGRLAALSP